MTNSMRGEIKIELGDKEFNGRVTLDTIMRIESALGKSVIKQLQSLTEAEATLADMVAMITPVVRAGGNDIKDKDIAQAVWAAGVTNSMKACANILAMAINPFGEESEGNEEAAAKE